MGPFICNSNDEGLNVRTSADFHATVAVLRCVPVEVAKMLQRIVRTPHSVFPEMHEQGFVKFIL
jgi:hypothetical protein